ncbi:MAG: cyclic nucleotide-binding domain-containing protein [Syntrophobacteraceae bacterium]
MEDSIDAPGGLPKPNPAQALEITVFRNGEEILREGEHSPFFYALLSGRALVCHFGRKIRILGEHDIFGLESLLLKKPCCYTVLAMEKCRVARYGPDALDHLIRESPRMAQSLLVSTLTQLTQTTYFLIDRPQGLEDVRVEFFGDGQKIVEAGKSGREIYRLVSTQGGLQVTMHREEIARIDKPGEFFGCVAGLCEIPRQAAVTSIGESVVEVYSPEDLDLLIRDHPEVALRMMRAMMTRLAEADDGLA